MTSPEPEPSVPVSVPQPSVPAEGEAVLPAGVRRRPRRAVRRGTEREAVSGVSEDERAGSWGEAVATAGGSDSNDDRLRQDVPPHYGR